MNLNLSIKSFPLLLFRPSIIIFHSDHPSTPSISLIHHVNPLGSFAFLSDQDSHHLPPRDPEIDQTLPHSPIDNHLHRHRSLPHHHIFSQASFQPGQLQKRVQYSKKLLLSFHSLAENHCRKWGRSRVLWHLLWVFDDHQRVSPDQGMIFVYGNRFRLGLKSWISWQNKALATMQGLVWLTFWRISKQRKIKSF